MTIRCGCGNAHRQATDVAVGHPRVERLKWLESLWEPRRIMPSRCGIFGLLPVDYSVTATGIEAYRSIHGQVSK
jgi:hypothetical protein